MFCKSLCNSAILYIAAMSLDKQSLLLLLLLLSGIEDHFLNLTNNKINYSLLIIYYYHFTPYYIYAYTRYENSGECS